jgi:hypothetical protein
VADYKFVIGDRDRLSRRFNLHRLPDGPTLSAGSWDDVWAACPEFNVPWRNVEFENDVVREAVLRAWGEHPVMPRG